MDYFDVVFDGPPSHVSGRFVEVEDAQGHSFKAGEWIQDGEFWRLRIHSQPISLLLAPFTADGGAFTITRDEGGPVRMVLPTYNASYTVEDRLPEDEWLRYEGATLAEVLTTARADVWPAAAPAESEA